VMGSDDLKVDDFIAVFKEMVDVFIGGACFLGWVFVGPFIGTSSSLEFSFLLHRFPEMKSLGKGGI